MKNLSFLLVLCSLFCLSVHAQKESWLKRTLHGIKNHMDSSVVKGVDPNYIIAPERPWQVITRYNIDQMRLKVGSLINESIDDTELTMNLDSWLRTGTAHRIGLWVGYRGYGIGYSVNTGKQDGLYFTAGLTGGAYGLNIRLRTFSTKDLEFSLSGIDADGYQFDERAEGHLYQPIRVRSLIIDGYYLFNGKHFSYTAAYDQSNIQLRSAGSLMAGAMWHNTTIKYDDNENAAFVSLMHDVGSIKIRQGSIGVGYAYNWVPTKGLLVNAMFMPMLTLYNKQKLTLYDVHLENSLEVINDRITFREYQYYTSSIALTYNARMSLTYNWKRIFFNVYGQWNHYRFNNGYSDYGHINDWLVNTSLGVRL